MNKTEVIITVNTGFVGADYEYIEVFEYIDQEDLEQQIEEYYREELVPEILDDFYYKFEVKESAVETQIS